jgi:hypothetical protein
MFRAVVYPLTKCGRDTTVGGLHFLELSLKKRLLLRGGDSRAAVRGLTNPPVAASTYRFRHLPIACS